MKLDLLAYFIERVVDNPNHFYVFILFTSYLIVRSYLIVTSCLIVRASFSFNSFLYEALMRDKQFLNYKLLLKLLWN